MLTIATPVISARSNLAANAFLSRYDGRTLGQYQFILRVLFAWFSSNGLDPLDAKRPHLELFVREHLIKERALTPVSINHYMTPIRGFYRFAVIDEVLTRDPSLAVWTPRAFHDQLRDDYLTAPQLRAMISAAKRSKRPSDQGLIALLAILGLRITEALNVQIEDYQHSMDGHRVLRLTGKGGKPATLVVTTACFRMFEVARGDRTEGPLVARDTTHGLATIDDPYSYHTARSTLDRLARDADLGRHITAHMFRRGWVTAGLDSGISLRDMQIAARHSDPRTTSRYDRGGLNLDRSAIHILSANLAGAA